ncbi:putative transcriptional regulatory protein [Zea mays]|uniref:Putative transcriptional regulatory protein n=1 Tax=Zea mays TaxID=4577 RepID=A0A1D6MAN9_MAIZE|nr:putative transcriptional regulatory protein [Zea mays]
MASATRALGALLHRASSLSSSAPALRGASLLRGDGPIGSAGLFRRHAARRRISSFQPLCMGRRSCKIAGRKCSPGRIDPEAHRTGGDLDQSTVGLMHRRLLPPTSFEGLMSANLSHANRINRDESYTGRQSFGFQNVVDLIHAYAAKAVTEQLDQNENLVSVNADVCNFWEKDVLRLYLVIRHCLLNISEVNGTILPKCIKKGGPNPSSNTTLSAILEKARELDVPREILERNIKRASEKGQDTYTEKVYEVYGFGGVGMVVEVLTDKITRSVADIRNVVKDCGAKLADPGSVTFRFRQARVVNIKVTDADKDQLLTVALDAGADDVLEPNFDDDDSEEEAERFYKIVTTSENYPVLLSKLQEEGLKFETDNGYELVPLNPIEVDDEAVELNKELVSNLLELDDVDAVYTDQK